MARGPTYEYVVNDESGACRLGNDTQPPCYIDLHRSLSQYFITNRPKPAYSEILTFVIAWT